MKRKSNLFCLVLFAVFTMLALSSGQQWTPLGPDGGDVRSLVRDPASPDRILLGTSAGQLYQSLDDGSNWKRLAKLGDGNDYVLDRIIFHPSKPGEIYVAAWSVENSTGDVFHTTDGGQSWKRLKGIKGKSIRGFAMSRSNPDILIAGALDGVYRSKDGGDHWELISPANHADIRNIQSIAIDPVNPDIIYAGTWHLPWKTEDGGKTWSNMKNGIIDDSDVFSIIVDPVIPSTLYLSACSGIYKSDSSGGSFRKVQGMPFSARRTRVLKQDPIDRNVVYAGTTEGLWKTIDSGTTWKRITPTNIIVNDVLLDAAHHSHVMIATDRSGVMVSDDFGKSFTASNRGFAHRQVATVLVDRNDSSTVYAGLINDKEFGGVFVSHDAGAAWKQMNSGLHGADVFVLRQTPAGELVAGTNAGVMVYRRDAKTSTMQWMPLNNVINVYEVAGNPVGKLHSKARPVSVRRTVQSKLSARVNDLQFMPAKWYAATSSGLFMSSDNGRSWHGGPIQAQSDFVVVRSTPQMTVAAARATLFISVDTGNAWTEAKLPEHVTTISDIAIDASSNIFIASREGAFRSQDMGASWEHLKWLPVDHLASIAYDADSNRLLVTSNTSTEMFESPDLGRTWHRVETGWLVRELQSVHGRILATTAFDGVVVQPEVNQAAKISATFSDQKAQR